MKATKYLVAAVAGLAVVTSTLLTSPPAHAAKGHCPNGATCLWRDTSAETNGNGAAHVSFQRYIPNLGQWKHKGTNYSANDSATSFFNNGQARPPYSNVYLFKGANGSGPSWKVNKGEYYWNLALQTATWNDTISSGYYMNWSPNVG